MQTWLREAVDDMESPLNKDLVLQCIRILSKLPVDSSGLSDTIFGRIIQKLTTRASSDSSKNAVRSLTGRKPRHVGLLY